MAIQKKGNNQTQSILDVVHACDAVQFVTVRADGWPETRHLANSMNRNATDLTMWFMTNRHSPKAEQIARNPKCSLYYYNHTNHHSVRLFGTASLVDDAQSRRAHWQDSFKQFGYTGPDDADFVLIRFNSDEYKYYDGDGLQTGKLK